MTVYIALFRGINVGGKNSLPMKDLVRILEERGLANVRTYIQSGNAVFESDGVDPSELVETIQAAIETEHGFRPDVLLLDSEDLNSALAANPFPEATTEPNRLHATFLTAAPVDPDLASLEEVRASTERFELVGKVFYLHAPDGIGRSKLFSRVERSLGVSGTTRNWRTLTKLQAMAGPGA